MPTPTQEVATLHALALDTRGGQVAIELPGNPGAMANTDTPRWFHFECDAPQTQAWLEQVSGLNDIARNALLSAETRPRLLKRGNNLLITLRGVGSLTTTDTDALVSIRIWTDGATLISTRKFPLAATDEVVEELNQGQGPTSIAELLTQWAERIIVDMSDTVAELEDQISRTEDDLAQGDVNRLRESLASIRKQTLALRRYLAPQREALARLASEAPAWFDEMNRLRLRETIDRLIRYTEDIDQIRDRAVLAKEDLASRIAEQMNTRSYLFTIAAVIFLPLGFLTGLLGVNVGGMPGIENPDAFWMVVLTCTIIAAALLLWFRWREWM